jgi:hypothetical protein
MWDAGCTGCVGACCIGMWILAAWVRGMCPYSEPVSFQVVSLPLLAGDEQTELTGVTTAGGGQRYEVYPTVVSKGEPC